MISRLVALILWPTRRVAMGDVTTTTLDGKPRIAEKEFGWSRSSVAVGINEFRSGIVCANNISKRCKPKLEEKTPELLGAIQKIMEPRSQAEPRLRTTLPFTNMTVQSVYDALIAEGWTNEYRLRTVDKARV